MVTTVFRYHPHLVLEEEEAVPHEEGSAASEVQDMAFTYVSDEHMLLEQAPATVEVQGAHSMPMTEELTPLKSTPPVPPMPVQEATAQSPEDATPKMDHTQVGSGVSEQTLHSTPVSCDAEVVKPQSDQIQHPASVAPKSNIKPTFSDAVRQPVQAKIAAAAANAAPLSHPPLVQSGPPPPRAVPSSSRIAPSASRVASPLQKDVLRQQTVPLTQESPVTFMPHPVPALTTSPRLVTGGLFPPAPAAGPSLPTQVLPVPKGVPFPSAPTSPQAAATTPAKASAPSMPIETPTAPSHVEVTNHVADRLQDLGSLSVRMSGPDSSSAIQLPHDFLAKGFSINGGLKMRKSHGRVSSESGVALLKSKKGMVFPPPSLFVI